MKFTITTVSTLGVAAALTLGAVSPAHAAWTAYSEPFIYGDVQTNGINSGNFSVKDSEMNSTWATAHPQDDTDNDNWDGHAYLYVEGSPYEFAVNPATNCLQDTDGGDILVKCDEDEVLSGLFAHPEIRYFGDENTERYVWYFRNSTGSSMEITVRDQANSECDGNAFAKVSNGTSGVSSSGGVDFSDARWLAQRSKDDRGGDCGVELNAWVSADADIDVANTLATNYDGQNHDLTLTIPAGETRALVFFYVNFWVDDLNTPFVSGDVTDEQYLDRLRVFDDALEFADDNFTRWVSWLGTGMTDAELAQVANWVIPTESDEEGLAPTGGTDNVGIAVGLIALVAAFAGAAIRRRRTV